jgi:predicted permease
MITELLTRLRFLIFRKGQGELDEELQFHLEQSVLAKVATGMTAEEARRQALIEFGGMEQTREQCHEQRPGHWLDTVAQDVRYALRGFRRDAVFTITVIATLALAIGATTAVFSVVDRILFRPLPFAQDDRLVSVGLVQSLEKQEFTLGGFFYDWRDNQKPFEAIASQGTMLHACDLVENNPAQLNCIHAQAGFLPLLGISPVLGRNFLPEEDRPDGPRVVLISYSLWMNHYNRDPGILNRLIDVDGNSARVIGVLPKDFQLPSLQSPDLMFPMALNEALERQGKPGTPMRTFARLRPGLSLAQASAELNPLFVHTRDTIIPAPIRKDFHLGIRSLRDLETKDVRLTAWILLGAVFAVLLIACANVTSLMMARSAARERELAVRSALGASRGRLIQQSLIEAGLLSLAGTATGLALAAGLLRVFLALAPSGIPFLSRSSLDLRIALFTAFVSLVCSAIFGLLPALQTPRAAALSVRTEQTRSHTTLRHTLVVAQIAISMILLSSAALLLRSFQNMLQQPLGMESQGVLTAQIALPGFRYNTGQKKMEFYLQLETALRRLPGIRAVSFTDSLPPGGWNSGFRFSDLAVAGRPLLVPGTGGTVTTRLVTPDYFRALNIPIVRGRSFAETERGSNAHEVILSRLLAAKLFPGEDPLGKTVQLGHNAGWSTVVGVAEDVKNNGLTEQSNPEVYALRRNAAEDWGLRAPILIVDSVQPPATIAPWLRSQVASIDPTVPVEMETLRQNVNRLANRQRFETALVSFFAFCGLLLAVVGLYGVISFVAAQRTQEIGIRMALGATRMNVLLLIAGEGVRLIVLGGILGLAAALAAAQLLRSLLYNVGPYDPKAYVSVTLLLVLVALIATLIPACAAMRVEPVIALRNE